MQQCSIKSTSTKYRAKKQIGLIGFQKKLNGEYKSSNNLNHNKHQQNKKISRGLLTEDKYFVK